MPLLVNLQVSCFLEDNYEHVRIYSDLIQNGEFARSRLTKRNTTILKLGVESFGLETESWHEIGEVIRKYRGNQGSLLVA